MGLYPNRGLEYHVVLPGRRAVVAGTAETDALLLESEYYRLRKDTWFDGYNEFCVPVEPPEPDIELTAGQQTRLRKALERLDVVSHGWYDVYRIYSSLDNGARGSVPCYCYVVMPPHGRPIVVKRSDIRIDAAPSEGEAPNRLPPLSATEEDVLQSALRVHEATEHGWFMGRF